MNSKDYVKKSISILENVFFDLKFEYEYEFIYRIHQIKVDSIGTDMLFEYEFKLMCDFSILYPCEILVFVYKDTLLHE